MNSSKSIKIRYSLGLKASIAVASMFVIISLLLSAYFIVSQKQSSMEELRLRSFSLADNLSYTCRYAVLSRDLPTLRNLIEGVKRDKDIVSVFIVDPKGQEIISTDSVFILGERMSFTFIDSTFKHLWRPSGKNYMMVTPIYFKKATLAQDETSLFTLKKGLITDNLITDFEQILLGYVVLNVSLKDMQDHLLMRVKKATLITFIVILVVVILVVFAIKKVVQPLYLLANATKKIAKGQFGKTVPIYRTDELGIVADSFNNMSRQLKKSRDEIDTLNRELENRVATSISELKEKYLELEKTYKKLKSTDSAKDDLLSLVVHEFRSPLNSIQIFSELMLKGIETTSIKREDYLNTIINNCSRLSRLISDLLDVFRLEAGQLKYRYQTFDLVETINESILTLKPQIEAMKISCKCSYCEDRIRLYSDRDRITQVIINILQNSIKYSPTYGKIIVSVTKDKKEEVIISVQDYGCGMKEEDIPRVFEKFNQLLTSNRNLVGSGLGMPIAKIIMEQLGGKIWIKSQVGKGTIVFVSLPMRYKNVRSKKGSNKKSAKR